MRPKAKSNLKILSFLIKQFIAFYNFKQPNLRLKYLKFCELF